MFTSIASEANSQSACAGVKQPAEFLSPACPDTPTVDPGQPDSGSLFKARAVPAASLTRDQQWAASYASRDLIFEKTVDLQNTLASTRVSPVTRAQMLDWMIEVLLNLGRDFSEATFFRAAQLMDMHFKFSRLPLTDAHVHLVGLTCIYIGSKYEDVAPVRIQELVVDAAYNKFSAQEVREKEVQILGSIKYQTSSKTHLEVLDFFYFRVFGRSPSPSSQHLRDLARNFCILALANVSFNDYDVRYVVLGCLVNSAAYLARVGQQGDPAVAATYERLHKRITAFIEHECVKVRYPTEVWQLIEFLRGFFKRFKKEFSACGQMCRLFEFDPRCLVRG